MARAVDALGGQVAALDGVDAAVVADSTAAYVEALEQLDTSIEGQLATVPPERRTLVTNHEVLGYFADRYGFEVVGAVVPSLTTSAAPSAADLTALADVIRERGVPRSSPRRRSRPSWPRRWPTRSADRCRSSSSTPRAWANPGPAPTPTSG